MRTISSVEANGVTFVFEPPVPMRDDEGPNPSLARVATFAWYGAEYPYGIGHDVTEGGFDLLITQNSHDPQLIAAKITEVLRTEKHFSVTLAEQ